MLKPWQALTGRGRAFLVLGILVVLTAMIAAERDVLRLGLLVIAVPMIAAILVARSRLRLSCDRSVQPAQITLGQNLEGRIVLGQEGLLPAGIILLEDQVPPELGNRPRFVVDRAEMHWERDIRYPLTGLVRGRFHTGPLLVRTTDPFGLIQLDRHFHARSEVLVTPEIVPLGGLRGIGGGGSTGEERPHRVGVLGSDDVLVREYHQGDDVRRVHWRSTAKRGELMVRREEQAWDPSASIMIDSRIGAHAGDGAASSFEWAVSAGASIASRFLNEGFSVEMYDAEGSMHLTKTAAEHTLATRQAMLHRLTDITMQRVSTMHYGLSALTIDSTGQVLVAIAGRLSTADATALARARRFRTQGLAILLDVDSFAGRGIGGETADAQERVQQSRRSELELNQEILLEASWRVVTVSRGTDVATAWAQLDQTAPAGASAGRGAA